ncbi:MAG: acyl carrier protein [Acidobacteria bacterium]|nr:acyl carrier protein [Acidobacteriota bacterium]
MTRNIEGEIRKVIADVFEIPEDAVKDEVNFYTTYNIDSLRMIEVVVELDRRLSLRIPPPEIDLESIETFGQLLELINRYIPKELAAV